PLIETKREGVFASLWEGKDTRIWTLVNRHEKTVSGDLLMIKEMPGYKYYDLVSGASAHINKKSGNIILKGEIKPRSIGCFIAVKSTNEDFDNFLKEMRSVRENYNDDNTVLPAALANLKKVQSTRLVTGFPSNQMVEIKPAIIRQSSVIESRECGTYYSSPVVTVDLSKYEVFPRTANISRIAIDITPVTNNQYYDFIKATGYKPKDNTNFLKHWKNGTFPEGKANYPVVYVDLDDARAYAAWAGKRLPREEEWQYAAQGYGWPKYPWGGELKDDCYNNTDDITPVDAYPKGKSPVGCLDMCSNTWELTESEYADYNNRFCMLKGGSFYQAKGSHWYTKGGPMPSELSAKFLMMYPGLDRCGTIGFRCVMDLES
ncbi:MAG: SUMF1/EgtB/PvdO family nonheme iron enzyme, partial [Chitinophagaceae bacterium]|nr:SUMF1/EgtB/PvdO family nonheme iron enzyme [Chitinophagaceae bacterium]